MSPRNAKKERLSPSDLRELRKIEDEINEFERNSIKALAEFTEVLRHHIRFAAYGAHCAWFPKGGRLPRK